MTVFEGQATWQIDQLILNDSLPINDGLYYIRVEPLLDINQASYSGSNQALKPNDPLNLEEGKTYNVRIGSSEEELNEPIA